MSFSQKLVRSKSHLTCIQGAFFGFTETEREKKSSLSEMTVWATSNKIFGCLKDIFFTVGISHGFHSLR